MGDDAAIALQLHLCLNGRSRRGCRQEQDADGGLEMASGDKTKAIELSSQLCGTSAVNVAPRTIHRPQNRPHSSSRHSVYTPGIQKVKQQLGRMARAATQQQLGPTKPHQLPAATATISHAARINAVQSTPTLPAKASAWQILDSPMHECKRGEQVCRRRADAGSACLTRALL